MSQPEIPEVDMRFSNADVTAYIDGNSQRTEEITFKASELQTITMKLPSGVKLHNVTTGKTSSAGASVEICGGTKFYLSAPLTQAVDVKGEWSVTMKGSIIKDYSAYKITTGSETQDLALVFGEGVTDEKYVDFKVSWVKQATLEIVKKDRKSNKAIADAVYGIYSDKDGKNLITKMPATDANGASSVTITKTQDTVEIYAAEDIKAADGVSPDYYSKDELVATVTTDANGVAKASDLPVGKYYVKEVGTAYGYVLDEEPRYVDLSYRDQDTPVVVYDEDWQNNRQKVKVNVLKKEKDTDRVLKGGIFGLYTRNDILSASGKVLMEADTLIELKTTDADGKISFIADLPIDGTYYVKELYAPDGFVTTGEEQEFVFEYQGDKETEAVYEFVFEDEPTTVELSKTDLTTGEELPGARLQLTDGNGAVVEKWTSTEEPHIIKELVVGKSYTLTETKPADGYATAESITFTVEILQKSRNR